MNKVVTFILLTAINMGVCQEFKTDLISVISAPGDYIDSINSDAKWTHYSSIKGKFQLDFPSEPIVEEGLTDKGRYKLSVKKLVNNTGFILGLVGLSSDINSSQYEELADNTAIAFLKKLDQKESNKSTFEVNGQKGVEYEFEKNGLTYSYRSICINGFAYQLIYVDDAPKSDLKDNFFGSFKVN